MKKALKFFLIAIIAIVVLSVGITMLKGGAPVTAGKVALVKVEGPIFSAEDIVEEIKNYREDNSIRAIVIRVNSPGGAVVPSQEIYDEVKRTAQVKKVIISMGSLAASGGYYISAPATKIIANPATLTGSIGVIMELPDLSALMKKLGVESRVIKSGRYKDLASVFRTMGKEEREILQGVMDDVHDQFINAVASGRHLSVDKVKELADGRVFTGRQAIKLGLVDAIGNEEDAINEAARMAGIQGKPKVVYNKGDMRLFNFMKGSFRSYISEFMSPFTIKYMMKI